MSRYLVGFCFVVVVVPHLIPLDLDNQDKPSYTGLGDFKDDGKSLPSAEQMEKLASKEPIAFLEFCLRRQEREVTGYRLTFSKQERIGKNLEKPELIDVWFKEQPHSVFMKWREGERLAARALYVEGENNNMAIIKPAGLAGRLVKSVERDPRGKEAKNSGRYPIPEFGLKNGLKRTLESWKNGKKDNALVVEYQGKKKVDELGGRLCYVFKRDQFKEPEGDDRVAKQILYVDVENWLLVGSILENDSKQLVARYFFRDVQINPKFDDDQFTRKRIEAK